MSNLCIIPARGGSKRIPRKNIRDFLGKPIIAYSIEAAIASGLFDEVMVSTDDMEIAEVAKQYGASVPFFRSAENSNDFASTMDVIHEVVSQYNSKNIKFKFACCIYATAPFVNLADLQRGYHKLLLEQRTSIFPIVKFSYPIWRGVKISENGEVEMVWPNFINTRSQDLEDVYHDAGQWYWIDLNKLSLNSKIFSDNSASVELDPICVQDLDNESDWQMAELKYELLQRIKK